MFSGLIFGQGLAWVKYVRAVVKKINQLLWEKRIDDIKSNTKKKLKWPDKPKISKKKQLWRLNLPFVSYKNWSNRDFFSLIYKKFYWMSYSTVKSIMRIMPVLNLNHWRCVSLSSFNWTIFNVIQYGNIIWMEMHLLKQKLATLQLLFSLQK